MGVATAVLGLILFALPADVLFGAKDTDLINQFLSWREFAAVSIRAGHMPFWNPYVYGGQPFLGGFQSALFYPPNILFLVLPVCRAANLIIVGHLLILGIGMRRLASLHGIRPFAANLCGVVLMLSGPVFPHLYAGHLPNLCTMAWTPWILAGLARFNRFGERQGLLYAAVGVFLQITAGHVQYLFYTGIAAGVYSIVQLVAHPALWRRAVVSMVVVYIVGAALGAVQLFPGISAASECVRGTKTSFAFVSIFSFPPEDFLTLIAPGFFGPMNPASYWGRCLPWEMTCFIGASTLVFIGAATSDPSTRREAIGDLAVAAVLFAMALGKHTPVYHALFVGVPGFDLFRGPSKFIFPAGIFLVLAAGRGMDTVIHRRIPGPVLLTIAIQTGVLAVGAGAFLLAFPDAIGGFFLLVRISGEGLLQKGYDDVILLHQAGHGAGQALVLGGLALVSAGGSLWAARRFQVLRWIPVLVLLLEMAGFARFAFTTSHYRDAMPEDARRVVATHEGDYRVLDITSPNNGFLLGAPDIWGDDPALLKRYAEFIAFTQHINPDRANQGLPFRSIPRLYAMLRCRFLISHPDHRAVEVIPHPMRRVQLLTDYRVIPGRDEAFAAMSKPDFDPAQTVILEREPSPRPAPGIPRGWARVVDATSDQFTIVAHTERAALLLITDPYSRYWRALPLKGSAQAQYEIVPANYALRAIPLAAGSHRIRLVYQPGGFRLGLAVSSIAWILWLVGFVALRCGRFTNPHSDPNC